MRLLPGGQRELKAVFELLNEEVGYNNVVGFYVGSVNKEDV
jgi:hypothetical protein